MAGGCCDNRQRATTTTVSQLYSRGFMLLAVPGTRSYIQYIPSCRLPPLFLLPYPTYRVHPAARRAVLGFLVLISEQHCQLIIA